MPFLQSLIDTSQLEPIMSNFDVSKSFTTSRMSHPSLLGNGTQEFSMSPGVMEPVMLHLFFHIH